MTSRSLMVACVVLLGLVLALPVMAQGGPPPGAPQGGMLGMGQPGQPGMGMPGMQAGMGMGMGGGMTQAPPVVVVTDKYVFVAWMGTLSQYDVNSLALVKSVQLPSPMGRGGRGGREGGQGGPGGPPGGAPGADAPPPPPAPAGG